MKSVMPLIGGVILFILSVLAYAAPQLVTPRLGPGIKGEAYTASLTIGSVHPLSSAGVTGLPAGLTASHNGNGGIAISGIPTIAVPLH
ncbi:MAG: hypothetical protein IPP88_09300 [Betaproteobacteria bacterium]|nr:hypothetical protein [Betaproteobacteria bacterium]